VKEHVNGLAGSRFHTHFPNLSVSVVVTETGVVVKGANEQLSRGDIVG